MEKKLNKMEQSPVCKSCSKNGRWVKVPHISPGGFLHILHRLLLRPLVRHPLLAGLNILSIALGVAVFSSIQIANRSANAAFRNTVALVSGQADLEVRGRIPEETLPRIAALPGVLRATPTVEWIAPLPDHPGEFLRILGVDPFSSGEILSFALAGPDGGAPDLEAWLREPDSLAVFASFLRTDSAGSVRLETPGGILEFTVRFLLQTDAGGIEEDSRLAAMDISWAQEAAGLIGLLTSIQLDVKEEAQLEQVRDAVAALLPGDVTVQPPAGRTKQTEGLLASFQLNLTALSMVSLLVGCYLIFNTVSASILRRRTEIGILRSLGASPVFLRSIFLLEAGLAGFVGAILGLILSVPLAGFLTSLVSRTISSLYVLLSVERIVLSPWLILAGLFLGVLAAVSAAWFPSTEAVRVDPKHVLHPGHLLEKSIPPPTRQFIGGLLCLVLAALTGWMALVFSTGVIGFFSAFFVITGFSLCLPLLTRKTSAPAAILFHGRLVPISLGLQNLSRSLYRNSVTIAALAAAVAMLVSISVMIHSFRGSVAEWMERTLVADVFFAPAVNTIAGHQNFLNPVLLEKVRSHPAVQELATFREVPLLFRGHAAALGVFSGSARGELDFIEGGNDERAQQLTQPGRVAVSESFANRFGVRAGEEILLPLPAGNLPFQVVGTYRDYTRDSGMVLLSADNYFAAGGDDSVHSGGVFLKDGADASVFARELGTLDSDGSTLSIYVNRELKERVGEVFDQTFAITGVLRLVAIVVAVSGVLLSLGILINERAREIGVLRSIGASRPQIMAMVLGEAGAVGLLAGMVGLLSGSTLALVLTYVINKAFFGWTVTLAYPWIFLAWTPVWVIAAALAASLWPAWRAATLSPSVVVRYE